MVLTLHHLGLSQSERILLLLEELGVDYNLVKHDRAPTLAPDSFKNLPGNKTGQAPFLEDPEAGITLSESGAICDYILAKHGAESKMKMEKKIGERGYVDYIYFYHYANATLQPAMAQVMMLSMIKAPDDNFLVQYARSNVEKCLKLLDAHLGKNKWLAGEDFTAADCMMIYSLTTKRYFGPLTSYEEFPNIVRYLGDIGARPAYKRALEKGDPEMQPLLGAKPPSKTLLDVGGITSDIWKKK
jgi:glutathione S-transferase